MFLRIQLNVNILYSPFKYYVIFFSLQSIASELESASKDKVRIRLAMYCVFVYLLELCQCDEGGS